MPLGALPAVRGWNVKQITLIFSLFVVTLFTRVAGAVPVVDDKEKGILINVGALIQPTFQMTMPGGQTVDSLCGTQHGRCSAGIGNPRSDGPSFDFFLRRARLMLWGSVTKEISYFIETDEPNLGKGGDFTVRTFIQDAFLTYSFMPELRFDAGLMLSPLSHHTLEGATSLNALDYHSDTVKFPAGRIFRDVGVQVRGVALQDHLHYRLMISEGVRNGAVPQPPAPAPARTTLLNPGGVPRFTAHLRGNIVGVEPDFFLKGIYFSKTPIVSVGVGADFQPNSVMKLDRSHGHYFAASGDVFAEVPFTEADELIIKANYFYYAQGFVQGTTQFASGATALYGEVGFRHAWVEPLAFVDYVKANGDEDRLGAGAVEQSFSPHVGVNFWIMKHNFNIKTDFGYKQTTRHDVAPTPATATAPANDGIYATQKDFVWTTQGQVFF